VHAGRDRQRRPAELADRQHARQQRGAQALRLAADQHLAGVARRCDDGGRGREQGVDAVHRHAHLLDQQAAGLLRLEIAGGGNEVAGLDPVPDAVGVAVALLLEPRGVDLRGLGHLDQPVDRLGVVQEAEAQRDDLGAVVGEPLRGGPDPLGDRGIGDLEKVLDEAEPEAPHAGLLAGVVLRDRGCGGDRVGRVVAGEDPEQDRGVLDGARERADHVVGPRERDHARARDAAERGADPHQAA
jgi:hypothetical protein